MLKTGKIAALAIVCALASNVAFAKDKSAAIVNGVAIPEARFDMRLKVALAQGQKDTPELRKAIVDDLVTLEVLSQKAVKEGLNKKPDAIQKIEIAKQQVLAGEYLQDYAQKHPITDEEVKQEYEKMKVKLGDKEYEVRHILVGTEDEAKAIIAQLGKKASFEKLAEEKSKDAGSKDNGGSLGWIIPGNYVAPVADAILKLKKGEYTKEPVQSQFGYHIIKLDDVRDLKIPPLDEVKPQLQQRLQQQQIQKLIADLRIQAKIE